MFKPGYSVVPYYSDLHQKLPVGRFEYHLNHQYSCSNHRRDSLNHRSHLESCSGSELIDLLIRFDDLSIRFDDLIDRFDMINRSSARLLHNLASFLLGCRRHIIDILKLRISIHLLIWRHRKLRTLYFCRLSKDSLSE